MDQKIIGYENDSIKITYDLKRCIHARECVKGLPNVFDPKKRPWIQPENATADKIRDIVKRCPTGALHYTMKKQEDEEQAPPLNTVSLSVDGPVYFRGNIEVQDADGEVLLQDTRWALCRCGQSDNKPACDNSHSDVDFQAHASFDENSLEADDSKKMNSKLVLKALKNGPLLVQGAFTMYSEISQPVRCTKNIALCRCGGSENKPFCDGTHKEIGFTS